MTILLKRNDQRDTWYTVHRDRIKEGDIVKLVRISNKRAYSDLPADIVVSRHLSSDPYEYLASLNCFDYVRNKK